MPYGFAIAAGGAVLGSVISANGAQSAADTQAAAANSASQVQQNMFNTTQKNLQPYMQAGETSLSSLLSGLGLAGDPKGTGYGSLTQPFTAQQFQSSPGYQFQLQQGLQGVTNAASATGGINSGNTLKALTQYGQGVANQDYYNALNAYTAQQNNTFNKLQTVAGSGQNASANLGALGSQVAGQIGANTIGAGNAAAAGQVGAANAIGSGISSLSQLAFLQNLNGSGNSALLNQYGSGGTGDSIYGAGSGFGDASGSYSTSDRRAKTNIKEVGETDNGLPVYSYRMKGSDKTQIGLMADDVEKVNPKAVKKGKDGLKRVNYMKALMTKKAA